MTAMGVGPIIQHLRRTVQREEGCARTDGQLLQDFITHRSAAAFEGLVQRHGGMVIGVCRRVLGDAHDAEDAFQATFLVLARKAASVVPREMVGNWLYGVAHTTAVRVRAANAKRRAREKQVANMPEPMAIEHDHRDELQQLVDDELARLPDKYRVPIVLCDLEGRSRREVAAQLALPEGTLSSRLTNARRMLARRLAARGFALSAASLPAAFSHHAASAMPAALAQSTVKAATMAARDAVSAGVVSARTLVLTEGVVKTMFIAKLKMMAGVLLVLGMLAFGGAIGNRETALAQEERPPVDGAGRTHPAIASSPRSEAVPGTETQRRAIAFSGVGSNSVGTPPTGADEPRAVPVEVAAADYNVLFDQALIVLGDYFKVEYANRYDGRIETLAAVVQSAAGKNAGAATTRRRAMLQITPVADGTFSVQLRVLRERQLLAAQDSTKPGAASTRSTWERDGRDSALEETILKRLAVVAVPEAQVGERAVGPLPPAVERRVRQFQVEATLVQVEPNGKDFGDDGKGKLLAAPRLLVPEGADSYFLTGGEAVVPGDVKDSVDRMPYGVAVRVRVTCIGGGRYRMTTILERTALDEAVPKGSQASGRIVRSIAVVKLGESIKLNDADDDGSRRYWLRVRIVEEQTVVTETRSVDDGLSRKSEMKRP
jgi:RNA polymerase sigma factor (sigma-70 family)